MYPGVQIDVTIAEQLREEATKSLCANHSNDILKKTATKAGESLDKVCEANVLSYVCPTSTNSTYVSWKVTRLVSTSSSGK